MNPISIIRSDGPILGDLDAAATIGDEFWPTGIRLHRSWFHGLWLFDAGDAPWCGAHVGDALNCGILSGRWTL